MPKDKENYIKNAFTLAEVLITLAIIGVVAAMTIPTLLQEYKERQYKIQSTNFQRKFGETLKIMDTQSKLQGYATTEEFVDELQNHIKISKVCKTNPMDCFEKSLKLSDGSVYDATNVKTSSDLGRANYNTNIVGLQFGDGVEALVAYNPQYSNNDATKTVTFTYKQDGKLKLVNMSTGVVSIVFDTTGAEKPNQVGQDITGVNAMLGGQRSSNEPTQIGPYQVLDLGTGYSAIPCISSTGINSEYCGTYSEYTQDAWAGANKACADLGMRLPSSAEANAIYAYLTQEDYSGINLSDIYYWIGANGDKMANVFNFSTGILSGSVKKTKYRALCIQ